MTVSPEMLDAERMVPLHCPYCSRLVAMGTTGRGRACGIADAVGRGPENARNGAAESHRFVGLCPMCWSAPARDGHLCDRCLSCLKPFCVDDPPLLRTAHEHVCCRACDRWQP